ncbi:hypothetical protein IJQ19_01195 [bacterium]|nr:hypothetical protein [bacterium]
MPQSIEYNNIFNVCLKHKTAITTTMKTNAQNNEVTNDADKLINIKLLSILKTK